MLLLSKEQDDEECDARDDEECDARDDDSSNLVGLINFFLRDFGNDS